MVPGNVTFLLRECSGVFSFRYLSVLGTRGKVNIFIGFSTSAIAADWGVGCKAQSDLSSLNIVLS